MLIKFLKTVTVDAADGETFTGGKVYDLSEPSAQRWLRRQLAVEVQADTSPPESTAMSPAENAMKPRPSKKTAGRRKVDRDA